MEENQSSWRLPFGQNESSYSLNHNEKPCRDIAFEIPWDLLPKDLETTFRREECIYKAPAALCDSNRASYTPRVISIGPFHHGSERLRPMEIQKQRYLKEFCKRLGGETKVQESLKVLWLTIQSLEDKIKRHYASDTFVEFSSDDDQFVKMILFDAVFIFELFLKNEEDIRDNKRYQDDFIVGKPWLRASIQRDLILLENQLPFFILKKLYRLAIEETKLNYPSFLDLSCHYFEKYGKNKTKPDETKPYKPLHFTDLVRHFLSFKHPQLESPYGKQIKNLYSATMLHEAGIKFKALPNACLLDIRAWKENENPVKKGELHMPPFEIDNSTECLFRNLMALEQCHYPREEFICRYVKLLDFLVDVEEDVDLLIENKVIVGRLGDSKAVAELINKLCLEIVEVTSGYDALTQLLNDYCESSWKKNKVAELINKLFLEIVELISGYGGLSKLRNDYYVSSSKKKKAYLDSVCCHNVWIVTGTVVGLIILAITVTRFIFFR